jgi:hypothetical protein
MHLKVSLLTTIFLNKCFECQSKNFRHKFLNSAQQHSKLCKTLASTPSHILLSQFPVTSHTKKLHHCFAVATLSPLAICFL